ncbi:MAG: hypothetical protein K0R25_905 [Rickettsiaceae bacterium]|jgi:plastocyanin|nr:hypothetical protein [Rickettsiaceae bacterium]
MKKIFLITAITLSFASFAAMADVQEYKIVLKDHKFTPQNLAVPAGKKVKLIIENQDETVEEFESYDLNREKIIQGGKSVAILIGPLKPGTYKYFGEFNQAIAQGSIVAK